MTTLLNFVKRHEGFSFLPYQDTVGKWTVFFGRNIDDMPCNSDEVKALFKAIGVALDNADDHQAELIEDELHKAGNLFLDNDLGMAHGACQRVFNDFDIYSVNRQISLISVMFNLGLTRFNGFKKMIRAIKDRDWKEAAIQLKDSKRHTQVPSRSDEEASMLEIG